MWVTHKPFGPKLLPRHCVVSAQHLHGGDYPPSPPGVWPHHSTGTRLAGCGSLQAGWLVGGICMCPEASRPSTLLQLRYPSCHRVVSAPQFSNCLDRHWPSAQNRLKLPILVVPVQTGRCCPFPSCPWASVLPCAGVQAEAHHLPQDLIFFLA